MPTKSTKPKLGLVDADMLVYLGGFAAQSTEYTALWQDHSDNVHQEFFSSKAAMKEWQLEHPEQVLFDEESIVTAEPIEHALSIVKNKLVEMDKLCSGKMYLYIRGEGNFRESIATLHPYKGNRKAPKPIHYDEIRRYLIEHWGARLVHGKEADDEIATQSRILGWNQVLICHADKDLDQIPGKHWNYSKNVSYEMSHDESLLFFYQQILSGDYADNVKGCWKLGTGRATEIVQEVYAQTDSDLAKDRLEYALWEAVVQAYEDSMGINGCPYSGMPAETVALENARLVWMQDEPGRLWTPPGHEPVYFAVGLDE